MSIIFEKKTLKNKSNEKRLNLKRKEKINLHLSSSILEPKFDLLSLQAKPPAEV
jgi:hypothetical protein